MQTAKSWLHLIVSLNTPSISENDKNVAYSALFCIALRENNYKQAINNYRCIKIQNVDKNILFFADFDSLEKRILPFFTSAHPIIPEELLVKIISFITDKETLASLAKINWAWYRLSNENTLWKIAFEQELQKTNPNPQSHPEPQKISETRKQIIQLVTNANIPYKTITQNIIALRSAIYTLPTQIQDHQFLEWRNYKNANNCLSIMLILNPHINHTLQSARKPLEYNFKVAYIASELAIKGFSESLSALLYQFRGQQRIIKKDEKKVNIDASNSLLNAMKHNQDECIAMIMQYNPLDEDIVEAYIDAVNQNNEPYIEWLTVTSSSILNYEYAIKTKNIILIAALLDRKILFNSLADLQKAIALIIEFNNDSYLKKFLANNIDFATRLNAIHASIEYNAFACLILLMAVEPPVTEHSLILEHAFKSYAQKSIIIYLIKTLNIPNIRILALNESAKYGRTDLIEQLFIPQDNIHLKSAIINIISLYYHHKLIDLLHYALEDMQCLKLLLNEQTIKVLSEEEDPLELRKISNIIVQLAIFYRKNDVLIALLAAGININLAPTAMCTAPPSKIQDPTLEHTFPMSSAFFSKDKNDTPKVMCSTGTPLMISVWRNSLQDTQLLLKHGAQIQLQFPSGSYLSFDGEHRLSNTMYGGYTAIHFASNNSQILKELLSARQFSKEMLLLKTDKGFTALHLAVKNGNDLCCGLLLNAKADPNTTDSSNFSALSDAIISENLPIIKLLLENNAKFSDKDSRLIAENLYRIDCRNTELMSFYIQLLFSSAYLGKKNRPMYLPLLLHFIEQNNIAGINAMITYLPTYISVVTSQVKLAFNWLCEQVIKPTETEGYKKAVELALNKCHWICAQHLLEVQIDEKLKEKGKRLPLKDYLKQLLYAKGFWKYADELNTKFNEPANNIVDSSIITSRHTTQIN